MQRRFPRSNSASVQLRPVLTPGKAPTKRNIPVDQLHHLAYPARMPTPKTAVFPRGTRSPGMDELGPWRLAERVARACPAMASRGTGEVGQARFRELSQYAQRPRGGIVELPLLVENSLGCLAVAH